MGRVSCELFSREARWYSRRCPEEGELLLTLRGEELPAVVRVKPQGGEERSRGVVMGSSGPLGQAV